jgi:hypothetical protein
MSFNPNTLPPTVMAAYRRGPTFWPLVVQKAVQVGIRDVDFLASVVFYLHYPERNGRPIAPHEKTMIDKWKAFRTTIKFQIPAGAPKPSEYSGLEEFISMNFDKL